MIWFERLRRKRFCRFVQRSGELDESRIDLLSSLDFGHLSSLANVTKRLAKTASNPKETLRFLLPKMRNDAAWTVTLAQLPKGKFNAEILCIEQNLEQSKKILDLLFPSLEKILPSGQTVSKSALVRNLIDIIEGRALSNVPKELQSAIIRNESVLPEQFIAGFHNLVQKQAAESLVTQIEKALSSALPSSCRLNKETCTSVIEDLMQKGGNPDQVVKQFMEQLTAGPFGFIDGLPTAAGHAIMRSGSPHSISRSEIRNR